MDATTVQFGEGCRYFELKDFITINRCIVKAADADIKKTVHASGKVVLRIHNVPVIGQGKKNCFVVARFSKTGPVMPGPYVQVGENRTPNDKGIYIGITELIIYEDPQPDIITRKLNEMKGAIYN